MKIKAAVVNEKGGKFQLEELDLAPHKSDEVLVKITAVGVCHTDEGGRQWMCQPPVVLGHEGSGIVEEVGSNVSGIEKGDAVILTVSSCGTCTHCKKNRPFACEKMGELNMGGKMMDGTTRLTRNGKEIHNFFGQSSFATYAVVNKNSIVKVDQEGVDLALLGPLGCGIQTGAGTVLGCLDAKEGSSIVIFGCGSLGLSGVMAAKIAKCKNIIAVGGTPDKLRLAMELGATHTINRKEVENVADEVVKICPGGAEYAFETTGAPPMFQIAINSVGIFGKVAVSGVGNTFSFDPMQLIVGSKSIIGSNEGNVDYQSFIPKMIEYYKKGLFPFDKLCKFYEFEAIEQAFSDSHQGITVKPILRMPE